MDTPAVLRLAEVFMDRFGIASGPALGYAAVAVQHFASEQEERGVERVALDARISIERSRGGGLYGDECGRAA